MNPLNWDEYLQRAQMEQHDSLEALLASEDELTIVTETPSVLEVPTHQGVRWLDMNEKVDALRKLDHYVTSFALYMWTHEVSNNLTQASMEELVSHIELFHVHIQRIISQPTRFYVDTDTSALLNEAVGMVYSMMSKYIVELHRRTLLPS